MCSIDGVDVKLQHIIQQLLEVDKKKLVMAGLLTVIKGWTTMNSGTKALAMHLITS